MNARRKAMEDKADQLRDVIADGQCKDYAEYQRKVGERKGLILALRIMDDRAIPQDPDDD